MEKIYDAIVIGARCAGSPTAMLLARKGYQVLLLEKAAFPSDTISTHIIFPPAVDALKRWGLFDEVVATNCPVITSMSMSPGPLRLEGRPSPINGVSEILGTRRLVLDKILADHAVQSGAQLRENCMVEDLVMEEGTVTGVRCKTKGGKSETLKARVVIGADGKNSIVARTVNAPKYNEQPSYTCWYYTYFSGIPIDSLQLYLLPNRGVALVPTNDDLVCAPVTWPAAEFHEYRSDIEGNYMKTFDLNPELGELMRKGKREAKFIGMADLPNFFHKPYGPGWALVGDAGYHRDPISGHGILDAFRSAEKLVDALDKGFSGEEPMDQALSQYEKSRNDEVMGIYHFTCDFAKLEPPKPEMVTLLSALPGNQSAIDGFLGALAGTVRIEDYFAPENLQQIIAKADVQRNTMEA